MVYRLGWVAGTGGMVLALLRLDRLLQPSVEGVPWQVVLMAAAMLGASLTWAGIAYRLDGRVVTAVNLAAVTITAIRVAVPATTWMIFPTLSSFTALRSEIEFAREVIRAGIAPVAPLAGLLAILTVLFWGLGALLAWGLLTGRPYLAVLAPMAVYLQFATMDRSPAGGWLWLFLVFLGASLLAVALDRRREGTGLLLNGATRTAVSRSLPAAAVAVIGSALLVTLLSTQAIAGVIPQTGVLQWRVRSGLGGDYYGGIAYNPFVGIRQGLVSQTNAPVFVAEVGGDLAPNRISWRILTLETFDGSQWFTADPVLKVPEEAAPYEDPAQAFRGPVRAVTQEVTILALEMGWLPAAYAPVGMTADNPAVEQGFRVKDDGSLRFDAISYRGMTYRVESEVPEPDLAVLSIGPDGRLSPLFQGAADDDAFSESPVPAAPNALELPGAATYLALPNDLAPGVRSLAVEQTEHLSTDFEKGLALEAFFRSPDNFSYSTAIEPGHSADDLAAWLLEPGSANYRTGYCEQFATAMAVMARQLGIPSRVVLGFTPGALLDDGRVVVRDRNAHAWVELWMPTQGWVSFDPTPRGDRANPSAADALPFPIGTYLDDGGPDSPPATVPGAGGPATAPTTPAEIVDRDGGPSEGSETGAGVPWWTLLAAAGVAAGLGLPPVVKWVRRRVRMRRLAAGDISAGWAEIIDHLDDLGIHADAASTPRQVAEAVSGVMVPLAEVYGDSLYGDPRRRRAGAVATAIGSLEETRRALAVKYSLPRRMAARYRMTSLVPRWTRRRPSRA
ncbi:MAG: DUF3488 and transglutaminase-like domain-containing protein [Actinobacteria bacterium]|nr:DUF3488 and transglutaminase-like domain-containing protein [Actinomycetota bacterium]MBU1865449.1 DUF3488 and transglutaminase-like domain-containing protein [Actinomycetota bacterium]